jgi:hypothetical protein
MTTLCTCGDHTDLAYVRHIRVNASIFQSTGLGMGTWLPVTGFLSFLVCHQIIEPFSIVHTMMLGFSIPIWRLQPGQVTQNALGSALAVTTTLLSLTCQLQLDGSMHMHEPINIALCLIVAIFNQHSCKFKLTAIMTLSCHLYCSGFRAPHRTEIGHQIPDLRIEMCVQDR